MSVLDRRLSRRRVEALVKGTTCDWCGEPIAVAFFYLQQGSWWDRLLRQTPVNVICACTAHVGEAQDARPADGPHD